MGIVVGTVNWNSQAFCKFSVTFCVDNEIGGSRLCCVMRITGGRDVFHSENRISRAPRDRFENFLDRKFFTPRGIFRGEFVREIFFAHA